MCHSGGGSTVAHRRRVRHEEGGECISYPTTPPSPHFTSCCAVQTALKSRRQAPGGEKATYAVCFCPRAHSRCLPQTCYTFCPPPPHDPTCSSLASFLFPSLVFFASVYAKMTAPLQLAGRQLTAR